MVFEKIEVEAKDKKEAERWRRKLIESGGCIPKKTSIPDDLTKGIKMEFVCPHSSVGKILNSTDDSSVIKRLIPDKIKTPHAEWQIKKRRKIFFEKI